MGDDLPTIKWLAGSPWTINKYPFETSNLQALGRRLFPLSPALGRQLAAGATRSFTAAPAPKIIRALGGKGGNPHIEANGQPLNSLGMT